MVPRPALFDRDGSWIAHRRDPGGGFTPVPVKLGPSTAGLVSIVGGLSENDVIALRDPGKAVDELLPGTAKGGGGKPSPAPAASGAGPTTPERIARTLPQRLPRHVPAR